MRAVHLLLVVNVVVVVAATVASARYHSAPDGASLQPNSTAPAVHGHRQTRRRAASAPRQYRRRRELHHPRDAHLVATIRQRPMPHIVVEHDHVARMHIEQLGRR